MVKSGIFLSSSINFDRSLRWCCWSIYKVFFFLSRFSFFFLIDYFHVYFHFETSKPWFVRAKLIWLFRQICFSNVVVELVVDRIASDINGEKQNKEGVLRAIDLRQIFRFFFFLSYIFLSYSSSLALPLLLSIPPGETKQQQRRQLRVIVKNREDRSNEKKKATNWKHVKLIKIKNHFNSLMLLSIV